MKPALIATFTILALGALAMGGCARMSGGPVGNRAVPQPAKAVDLARYLGRWYEIARYEAWFQRGCESVTADYALNKDGTIRVVNACRQGSITGKPKSATGKAKVADAATNAPANAKLKVSFFGPFYGDYWVLDHADDYSWSIVGEPSGRYIWILSRQPHLTPEAFATLEARVKALGYDWSLVRVTQQ